MIELKINDEIRDVKSDMLARKDLSQIAVVAFGVVIGFTFAAFLYFKQGWPIAFCGYVAAFTAAPFGVIGLYKYHEMTGAKVFLNLVKTYFTDKSLTYGSKNEVYCKFKGEVLNETKNTKKICRRKKNKKV